MTSDHGVEETGDGAEGLSDETWAQVRKHDDDDQTGALVCLVAPINAANRMNVTLRSEGAAYTVGMFAGFEDG